MATTESEVSSGVRDLVAESIIRSKEVQMDPKWYHGGIAGAMAAMITHPADTIKVHLQTQADKQMRMSTLAAKIVREQGIFALYSGVSASVLRQLTYSTARFAVYERAKQDLADRGYQVLPFWGKCLLAGTAGGIGGLVGAPADLINVRMQNDIKLQPALRRNYKHAVDGLYRISVEESPLMLFRGASMVIARAIVMTTGQLALYDQTKQMLLSTRYFRDNVTTHLTASMIAAFGSTVMTQPLDVIKTRMQNAPKGEYKSIVHCFSHSFQTSGAGVFYKGFFPALIRLGPHTVLMFVFFEQLRKRFGVPRS